MLRKALSDSSGPLGESTRRKLPEVPLVRARGETLSDLADHGQGTAADQATIIPSRSVECAHREKHDGGLLRASGIGVFGGKTRRLSSLLHVSVRQTPYWEGGGRRSRMTRAEQ